VLFNGYQLLVFNLFLLKLKLNPEGQGRQPPTDQPQPPAASHQLFAASRQPPSHLKAELSCFEFVYK
jgi:hypothetical protein